MTDVLEALVISLALTAPFIMAVWIIIFGGDE